MAIKVHRELLIIYNISNTISAYINQTDIVNPLLKFLADFDTTIVKTPSEVYLNCTQKSGSDFL
jgi:hypothetical protein